jgi:hypothetical protein
MSDKSNWSGAGGEGLAASEAGAQGVRVVEAEPSPSDEVKLTAEERTSELWEGLRAAGEEGVEELVVCWNDYRKSIKREDKSVNRLAFLELLRLQ